MFLAGSLLWTGCREADPPADALTPAQRQAEAARERLMGSEGGQLVLRAIDAHGGLEAWYEAPTSAYTWEYSNVDSDVRFKSYLVADNQTRRIYHDLLTLGTVDNPEPVDGRFAWDGEEAWITPPSIDRINPRFWASTGYYFESIPFILADPGLHYEVLPDDTLDGVSYDLVRVSYDENTGDSPDDTYTLYVNQDTGRVDAIRYTVTYYSGGAQPNDPPRRETLMYYEDYETVDGLTVPTRFRGYHYVDGEKAAFKNEAWASDISFREPFDASKLVRPPDARVQPMPEAEQ